MAKVVVTGSSVPDARLCSRRVARVTLRGFALASVEVSPSPVYGARLLSGLGV